MPFRYGGIAVIKFKPDNDLEGLVMVKSGMATQGGLWGSTASTTTTTSTTGAVPSAGTSTTTPVLPE